MSLYAALLTGVSGLEANGRALSITSSNIANINTVGYKTSSANFSTFLAASQVSDVSPSSVKVSPQQHLDAQGILQSTGSPTDLAISGNGFFIVTDNPANATSTFYTRAGSFANDADGYLRNSAGYYLEGWILNPDGSMPANRSSLSPLNLASLNGTAEESSTLSLRANLDASALANGAYVAGDIYAGTIPAEFEQTINVFDSQGGARPLSLAFIKTAANAWAYEIAYQGNVADIGGVGNNPIATGSVTFNSDGTLASPVGGIATINVPWDLAATGLNPQIIDVEFGTVGEADGVTQYDAASALNYANVNGAPFGALTTVSVDGDGFVTALFDNGIQRKVFRLPLATFANPNGLQAVIGNAYQITENSGVSSVLQPKSSGAGSISSRALESSTADLAEEFSNLITQQRAYSAATRIITTADDMLQELMQIKR